MRLIDPSDHDHQRTTVYYSSGYILYDARLYQVKCGQCGAYLTCATWDRGLLGGRTSRSCGCSSSSSSSARLADIRFVPVSEDTNDPSYHLRLVHYFTRFDDLVFSVLRPARRELFLRDGVRVIAG